MPFAGKTSLGVRGERPTRRTAKIRGGEPDRVEHGLDQRNMNRLPVVGSGRNRQLDRPEQGARLLSDSGLKRFGR